MKATHAFVKGVSGNGIFYRAEDFLVFITIVSKLVNEMGLTVLAFCPMFNHIHFLFKEISPKTLRSFIQRMKITFVKEYNKEYERKGSLFQNPYGYSIKKSVKIILGCVAYIFNNPVAGRLREKADEYRWSLLAYRKSRNPFSKRFRRNNCRRAMRTALDKVDYLFSKGQYLTYRSLRDISRELNHDEREQMNDYILSKYCFLSFDSLDELFGGYQKMSVALDSNAGSEFELEDEYGDHSCYRDMLSIVHRLGYKGKQLNFESLTENERDWLFNEIKHRMNIPPSNINKFLHRVPGVNSPSDH